MGLPNQEEVHRGEDLFPVKSAHPYLSVPALYVNQEEVHEQTDPKGDHIHKPMHFCSIGDTNSCTHTPMSLINYPVQFT